jgi:DNA-binding transcriptional ArsR family regulator
MAEPQRRFKDALYEQLARVSKALAAPKRLEVVDLLAPGPRTVEALAGEAGLSVENASQHLRVLRAARLVEREKKGLYVEYRLADPAVARVFVPRPSFAPATCAGPGRSPSPSCPRATRSGPWWRGW